jgi:hypothetical protein
MLAFGVIADGEDGAWMAVIGSVGVSSGVVGHGMSAVGPVTVSRRVGQPEGALVDQVTGLDQAWAAISAPHCGRDGEQKDRSQSQLQSQDGLQIHFFASWKMIQDIPGRVPMMIGDAG